MKHLVIDEKTAFKERQYRKGSVSIQMKMVIDDASEISPFLQMFCIDGFKSLDGKLIADIISENTSHISRTFVNAILSHSDCLVNKDT